MTSQQERSRRLSEISESKSIEKVHSFTEEVAVDENDYSSDSTVPVPQPVVSNRHRGLVFFFVLFAYFLFAFDTPVVANIRPKIIDELGDLNKLPFLSTVYSLSLTSTNLLWGHLYRNFNFKILFCAAVAIFEIGSAVCGSAPTMNALLVGRAICGLGGGGMYIGTLTYVTISTTQTERPKFMGLVGMTYTFGVLLGPIIGGSFAGSDAGWRWAFYFSLFVGAAAAPVYLFMLPNIDPKGDESITKRFSRFDFLGFSLFAAFVACWTVFPSFGGSTWHWSSGHTIALAVVCGFCFVAFVAQQYFCLLTAATDRYFPLHLLRQWEMWILFAQMGCAMAAIYVPLYFIPLDLQFVHRESPLLAGVKILPFLGTLCVTLMISGIIMSKVPIYMPYYLLGGLSVLAGGILLHFDTYFRSDSYVVGVSVLVGMVGLYAQSSFSVAQAKAGAASVAVATSFIGVAQVGSVNICLVISNSVFFNQAADKISAVLPDQPRHAIYDAVGGTSSALFRGLPDDVRVVVLEQIVASIREVYYMVIVAGALTVLLALCMKRERLGPKPGPSKA